MRLTAGLIGAVLAVAACGGGGGGGVSGEDVVRVRALVREGRFVQAKAVVDGWGRVTDPEGLYYRAFLAHRVEGRPERAVRMFGAVLRRLRSGVEVGDPLLEVKAVFYAAYAAAEAGREAEAERGFDEALSFLEGMERAGRLIDGEGWYMLAYCYDRRKESGLAERYYGRAAAFFATNMPGHYLRGGAFFNIGRMYYNRQDYGAAMRWWGRALAVTPGDGAFREHYLRWYEVARQASEF